MENECERCGWCCTHIVLKIADRFDKVSQAWLQARGIEVRNGSLVIPSLCPHIQINPCPYCGEDYCNDNTPWCDIYETRPTLCRISSCPRPDEK